ncbi:D-alanyl-D-alanine carboxypeptidase [Asticcacaulis sp. ZE23SCel15]|uniref:D-alanyl-D-alanine carboxypeptidase n=1 Tax=Asticcacaulis sp. ZE23SCel15 TaxID=3059027 RepID=UPI00265E7FEB|nr:D-alanyl-D-alanine carboxypeptidase [Asticcacaulis sp. ZE23SCel15]WKL57188.1 D-alanyl-D-alanine carboxypeptidase [Asticcacaulis sp. ZE23SCel15]
MSLERISRETTVPASKTRAMAASRAPRTALSALIATLICLMMVIGFASAARAQDLSEQSARYAAIVVDAQSGEVFYASRADSQRYPASLTKIMTLYMAFEAISMGELKPTDLITMSPHAASMQPVKVWLKAGDTIDVNSAMKLVALYSANDLAAALGEKIGGTEARFGALMTLRAKELGMTQTNFVNASGLPDNRQVSSARDFAILARAVMRDYPQYYEYFHIKNYTWRGKTYYNHNPLLAMSGVDGMKTGVTNAAGYNLVASQVKGNRRLIAVMLGGDNKSQRREHVTALLNTGFDVIARRNKGEEILVAQTAFTQSFGSASASPYTVLARNDQLMSDAQLRDALQGSEMANMSEDVQRLSSTANAPAVAKALADAQTKDNKAKPAAKKTATKAKKKDPDAIWAIQVGAFKQKSLAQDWTKDLKKRFKSNLAEAVSDVSRNSNGWYRTRFVEMTKAQAQKACKAIEAKRLDCMVVKS